MTTTYLERLLDPWREFDRMSRLLSGDASCAVNEFPAVNVWVNGEDAVITSEIPGLDHEKTDISVSGNTVTLHGSRPADEKVGVESYHRHELRHGTFSKTVKLPFNIDSGKVHASYRKGILHVSLPKLESEKPKKIKIHSE
jgi:HSP20 family protein